MIDRMVIQQNAKYQRIKGMRAAGAPATKMKGNEGRKKRVVFFVGEMKSYKSNRLSSLYATLCIFKPAGGAYLSAPALAQSLFTSRDVLDD